MYTSAPTACMIAGMGWPSMGSTATGAMTWNGGAELRSCTSCSMTSGVSAASAPAALPIARRTSVAAFGEPVWPAVPLPVETVVVSPVGVRRGSRDQATVPPMTTAPRATAIKPYGTGGFAGAGGTGVVSGIGESTVAVGSGNGPPPDVVMGCLRVQVSQPRVRDNASFTAAIVE